MALLGSGCAGPLAATGGLNLTGEWQGRIDVPGAPLDIGITLSADGAGTMDVAAQGATDLPLADVRVEGARFTAAVPGLPGGAAFDGTVAEGAAGIAGDYTQAGQTFPFRLERGAPAPPVRPQEPQPPLPYRAVDISYPSGDLTLAGTLTLPEGPGPFAAVVLITGSGPQDRDESVAGHRPFLVLADALTRAGYAVLRTDDRGVGGSGGDYSRATYEELTADVLAGAAHLASRPEIDPARIGLLGHSEGGSLAPLVAREAAGKVAFVVLMAGPAVSGEDVLVRQNERLLAQAGSPPAEVETQVAYVRELVALLRAQDYDRAAELTRTRIAEQAAALPPAQRPTPEQVDAQAAALVSPVTRALVTYDPAAALGELSVPVLAFYGGKDLQVPAEQSEPRAVALLSGNTDATVRTLPGLNHLMQPADTGSLAEYARIETTVAPDVLDLVTGWLQERF
ncbi:alpha/beta hydrolase family protein [Pseudonocardia petroleophila]|uniref:alpha/beta hydrolase family protein n=1 Tax=Pseudonocardia petroleophila TaxID=37331 RepID=UPI001C8B351A|nr:alpha/beta fold hydrolase [Pseudonocardia petroleophila]